MIGWFMVFTHMLDRGVLVVTLHGDVVIGDRAAVSQGFADLVRMYLPRAVVIELRTPVVSAAALSAVLRAHRLCEHGRVPLSLVAAERATRRLLEAGTDGTGLRVLACRDEAVAGVAGVAAPV
ncbi:hypothetical protein ABZ705_33465 [Streptomyces sp. NPDC006984]|uniref:hypothetical protein n=1 Tax=Streptomyces sp. NPDC006984 TaxID=3155463 RepID=UPI0033E6BA93